jgi:hypothetical protein
VQQTFNSSVIWRSEGAGNINVNWPFLKFKMENIFL